MVADSLWDGLLCSGVGAMETGAVELTVAVQVAHEDRLQAEAQSSGESVRINSLLRSDPQPPGYLEFDTRSAAVVGREPSAASLRWAIAPDLPLIRFAGAFVLAHALIALVAPALINGAISVMFQAVTNFGAATPLQVGTLVYAVCLADVALVSCANRLIL